MKWLFLGFFFRLFSPHSIWFIGFTTSQNKLILININKYYNITWIIQRFSTHSNGFKNAALLNKNKIQSLPKITSCLALFIMTIFASKYSRWTLHFLATFNIYYRWLLPCFRVCQSKTLIFQTGGLLTRLRSLVSSSSCLSLFKSFETLTKVDRLAEILKTRAGLSSV